METQLSRAEKLDRLFGTPAFAVIIAILCNAMWGSAFPFIKLGYRLFAIDTADTASILCFAGVRFMLGSVLVLGGSLLLEAGCPPCPRGRFWPNAVHWACGRPQRSTPFSTALLPCSPVPLGAS